MYIDKEYNKLILEAKSPEEIKQIAYQKFVIRNGVPEEIFEKVFSIDPTKKKTYTSWLLNLWHNEAPLIEDSLDNGQIRLLFHYFKTRNNEGLNLVGIPTLSQALSMLPDIDTVLEKIGDGPENDFDIVYDTPEWKIAVPHCYKAAEKLGKGCRWCTAGAFGNGQHWFDKYTRTGRNDDGRYVGPLWINFDYSHRQEGIDHKDYPYTRYQFLFEWDNWHGEFMDYMDQRVDPSRIQSMPEEVKDFYARQNERYEVALRGNTDDATRRRENRIAQYRREREQDGIVLKEFRDGVKLILMQRLSDTNQLNPNLPYHVYSSQDPQDPITTREYRKSENVIDKRVGDFPMIVLNDASGEKICLFKRNQGFKEVPLNDIELKHNGDNIIGLGKDARGGVFEILYADVTDNFFLNLSHSLQCLGKSRRITNIFKNRELSEAANENLLEISLDNGFHQLYVQMVGGHGYNFVWSNVPISGDRFVAENGFIEAKYGRYNLNSHTNYNVYSLINERFAILKSILRGNNSPRFNVFDSETRNLISDSWYTSITNLHKDNVILCDTSDYHDKYELINLNNSKKTTIYGFTTVRNGMSSYFVGKAFTDILEDGVQIRIPLSYMGFEFKPNSDREEQAVSSFLGSNTNSIRENFSNFYKRMIKK